MDQPRVQVLEEVHVTGVEAGVVIEIIGGRDGERDIRQLHDSVPNTPKKKKNPVKEREAAEAKKTFFTGKKKLRVSFCVLGECRVLSQTVLSSQLLTWILLYLGHPPGAGSDW